MIVIGFDTATQATAVGLRLADGGTLTARDDPAEGAHPGHATRLLEMASELLEQARLEWSELERIAVGLGPGRFTGLRVGIATARGLAQSLSLELVGVSSLHALALGAIGEGSEHRAGAPNATIAVIDARRREAFAAAYVDGAKFEFPRALRPPELEDLPAEIGRCGGPPEVRWRAVGDGALLYADELTAAGIEVLALDSPLHLIDGAAVCELGALATAHDARDPLATILPDYRRSPDASVARGTSQPALGASRA
ncbi:MAG TPA: tRNA (adenosine(37)-N6)-threonylcarbamoyltransferase complex dimerization subunit type 1 TsaB [Solirubrobacteraceae bacterium]|nr:tRNA (adenosine(37)-N6)-threonylcarbamoyltransferase complex dimerization subunit type 1 TsaB [Solirubrobacteraceae bacterium]